MPTRTRSRGVFRALAFGLLFVCPLLAVADPPPRVPSYTGELPSNLSLALNRAKRRPSVPLGALPQREYDHWHTAEFSRFDLRPVPLALDAAKRRNAEPVPFDLTYLPPARDGGNGPQTVVAVRPCAFFDRPGGERLARKTLESGAVDAVKNMFGLSALDLPALGELDMVLTRLQMTVTLATEDQQSTANVGTSYGVLRTRGRYDWLDAFRRLSLVRHTHRGREYRTFEVDLTRLRPDWAHGPINVAVFIPDDRTLVIDNEWGVKALIDRLADGKPVEEPAGWKSVSSGVFAAVAKSDKAWAHCLPGSHGPRLPSGGDWEWNVFDDMEELVVGLDDRPTTRFRLIATASGPFAAKQMAWNAKRLLALAEAHLAGHEHPAAEVVRALWAKGRFAPTRRGFEITADAGTDLLGPLLDRLTPPPNLPPPRGWLRSGNGLGGF